jgi:hypothetical protein
MGEAEKAKLLEEINKEEMSIFCPSETLEEEVCSEEEVECPEDE